MCDLFVVQQTEVLKVVFLTYFRILKHSLHSPLLQPVLEGLAKSAFMFWVSVIDNCFLAANEKNRFAHLINVDFFADLMSILHSLSETGVSLTIIPSHLRAPSLRPLCRV